MNLSSVKTRGLDFGLGYKRTILGTGIDTGIDGSYIFKFDNQFSSSAPVVSILNTSYNPINLRLRARALATRGPLSGGVYINFTNDYSNNNVIPYAHVSSWTTADAVASYAFGSSGGPFNGITVALSVINLTNRAPPFVSNTHPDIQLPMTGRMPTPWADIFLFGFRSAGKHYATRGTPVLAAASIQHSLGNASILDARALRHALVDWRSS